MKKNIVFSIVLALNVFFVAAQNAQQFTHYMFNQLAYNPAYAGFDNAIHLTALYRAQWVGIEGNPTLQSFSAHSPLNFANSNAGIYVVNDVMGAQRTTHFHLAYAYRQPLSFGNISFGVSAGIFQQQLNGAKLRAPQGNYETNINHNDNLIPNTSVNGIAPEINTGVYFNTKGLQLGISANNISASKTNLKTSFGDAKIEFTRYYTAMALYDIVLSKKFTLTPSTLLKTDLYYYQTDFNLILQYRNNIYLGSSFRGNARKNLDAVSFLFGFNITKSFRLGYSYDYTLSGLNSASNGSHEIFANYRILLKDLVKPGKKIYNPRFL
jgi:type IX secretion system PorP/SprF family membrane protein